MISPQGIQFIKQWEQLRLQAYRPTPDDVLTIGWGHTAFVRTGDVITEFEAEQLLADDLAPIGSYLEKAIYTPINQAQTDALGSLIFNIGLYGKGGFDGSSAHADLNKKDFQGFSDQAFSEEYGWVRQNGFILSGLVNRRAAERNLFFNADYGFPVS